MVAKGRFWVEAPTGIEKRESMLPLFVQKQVNRLRRGLWAAPLSVVPAPFRAKSKGDATIAREIVSHEKQAGYAHSAGSLPLRTLLRLEELLPGAPTATAETGCGKSTIFLSRISRSHKVFCLDDRESGDASSVAYFMDCAATRMDRIERHLRSNAGDATAIQGSSRL